MHGDQTRGAQFTFAGFEKGGRARLRRRVHVQTSSSWATGKLSLFVGFSTGMHRREDEEGDAYVRSGQENPGSVGLRLGFAPVSPDFLQLEAGLWS